MGKTFLVAVVLFLVCGLVPAPATSSTVSVTIQVSPGDKGLEVEVDGTRYAESETFTWQMGSSHTLRAISPQIGSDVYRYTFDRWSDGGAETHTVAPQQNETYTVYYTGEPYMFNVTVGVSPGGKGLQVEVDGTRYTESATFTWQKGTTHTLKAVSPQIGTDGYRYTFDRWSDGGAETHTVAPQQSETYTVYYTGQPTTVNVTVEVSPGGKGLKVEVDGTRYTESGTFTWQKASTHTLRAVSPQIGNDAYRYAFDRWSDGGAETHTATPQQDGKYTVYYIGESTVANVAIAVSPGGKGLQMEVDGTRYVDGGTFTWQKGTTHTLKAVTPQIGNDGYRYSYDRWSDGGAETHTVVPQQDGTYTVYYTGEASTVSARVTIFPGGKGLQVEVDGTRYAETGTFTWQKGSTHTLRAVSPQIGNDGYTYTFDHWSDGGAQTHSVVPQQDSAYAVYYTVSGTSPWDVHVTLGPAASETTLTWTSLSGKTYSVLCSDGLFAWRLAQDGIPAGGGGTTSWIDDGSKTGVPPSVATRRFYRVVENP